MTVRINKSAFNIREKLSELERPIGLKGSELMRAETVQEARNLVSAGRKNLLINGDMRVAQRGTSGTKSGNSYGGYLSVDRWAVYYDDTIIAQTDVTINGRPKKALKVTGASPNGRPYVYQKIENCSRLVGDGTPFSISFWARASANIEMLMQWRYYDTGTENSGSNSTIETIDITTEWKHYKFENITKIDANYNITRDGGVWFYNADNSVGSGIWFECTEVQVELGKVATEFEHRSFGEELALCQRYYQKSYNYSQPPGAGTSSGSEWFTREGASGRIVTTTSFQVQMRATPTFKIYDWAGNIDRVRTSSGNNQTITESYAHEKKITVGKTASISELLYQWYAEAEL